MAGSLSLIRIPLRPGCREWISAWDRCHLNPGIFYKGNILTVDQPAFVEGKAGCVEPDASSQIPGTCHNANHTAYDSETVGCYRRVACQTSILIKSASCEKGQH
jgi:hypothetical protein